jgi:hypothetical protein
VAVSGARAAAKATVGFLNSSSPDLYVSFVRAWHQGLGETGYSEGRNVVVEHRWAMGHYDRLPALVAPMSALGHSRRISTARRRSGATVTPSAFAAFRLSASQRLPTPWIDKARFPPYLVACLDAFLRPRK